MKQVLALLGTYKSSTILGIAVLGGAVTTVLLDQATPKQAAAAVISGLIAIMLRQETGSTTVTGPATVQAESVAVTPQPGTTTTIR